MDRKERDITYRNRSGGLDNDDDNDFNRREGSDNSYSVINPMTIHSEETQEEIFYDELDRKCTLKKSGTKDSKIILYRARTHYRGKRIFDFATALLLLIGIALLVFFIIISARKGWSKANISDVNAGNKIALLLQAIFVIFIGVIGLSGSYIYWKTIILMVALLSALGFVSHCYLAKEFLDITRFADRNMAIAWWDSYTDETIMAFQEEYNCCGYLNYKDRAFVSKNCPKDLVTYTVPADVYKAASVLKNDTYKKKYWKQNGNTANTAGTTNTTNNTGNTDNTAANTTGNTANTNTATDNTTDNTTTSNGTTNDTTANGATDNTTDTTSNTTGETENTGNDDGNVEGGEDEAMEKRSIKILSSESSEVMDKIGEEIKNSIVNGKGRIFVNNANKEKRQEADENDDDDETNETTTTTTSTTTTNTTTNALNVQGCQRAITDKVKSGITPIYIALFSFLIVYAIVSISAIVYWADLRNEKEYDEFS